MCVYVTVTDEKSAVSEIMTRDGNSANEMSGPNEKRACGNFICSSEDV